MTNKHDEVCTLAKEMAEAAPTVRRLGSPFTFVSSVMMDAASRLNDYAYLLRSLDEQRYKAPPKEGTEKGFFVVVEEDVGFNKTDFVKVGTGCSMANGYKVTKIEDNAVKRLQSAALTEPGKKFFLMRSVAEASVPTSAEVKRHKS